MSNMTFSLSKENIGRLKTLSTITNKVVLKREMLVIDETESIIVKMIINDLPDDFELVLINLSSFLNTYNLFKEAYIDYSNLEEKNYVKIISLDGGRKQSFKYVQQEITRDMENHNFPMSVEKDSLSVRFEGSNSFILSSTDLVNMIKSGKILGAEKMLIETMDDYIQVIVNYDENMNVNTYTVDFDECEINNEDIMFNLSHESFSKLLKNVEYYKCEFFKNSNNEGMVRFISDDEKFIMYSTEMMR